MRRFFVALFLGMILVVPMAFAADTGGFVPCTGPECEFCHLVTLGNRILTFFIYGGTLLAILLVAFAGYLMIFDRGSEENMRKGKSLLLNALIGFIIILASWLIVDTFMRVFTQKGGLNAWALQCSAGQPQLQETPGYIKQLLTGGYTQTVATGVNVPIEVVRGGQRQTETTTEDRPVTPEEQKEIDAWLATLSPADRARAERGELYMETSGGYVGVKGGSSAGVGIDNATGGVNRDGLVNMCDEYECKHSTALISPSYLQKYDGFATELDDVAFRVTAGTEGGHQNRCHQNGTCVDIACDYGPCDAEDAYRIVATAQSHGLKAVFEGPPEYIAGLRAAGVPAGNTLAGRWVPHASLYQAK